MTQLISILISLSTTLLGYVVGRLWQRMVDQIPYRRARRFWGPTLAGEMQIVVSRFRSSAWRGPTGVVGGGDALALRKLGSYFSKVGLKNFDVVYVDEANLDRQRNLILLGGPDTNEVTKDALRLIQPHLRIFDPGPGGSMEIHDLSPEVSPDKSGIDGERLIRRYRAKSDTDYGIIIRACNPFNKQKALVIIAGTYGYGTWGGVNLATEDRFLELCKECETKHANASPEAGFRNSLKLVCGLLSKVLRRPPADSSWLQLECIFKVSVFDQRPYAPEIIAFRPLS